MLCSEDTASPLAEKDFWAQCEKVGEALDHSYTRGPSTENAPTNGNDLVKYSLTEMEDHEEHKGPVNIFNRVPSIDTIKQILQQVRYKECQKPLKVHECDA